MPSVPLTEEETARAAQLTGRSQDSDSLPYISLPGSRGHGWVCMGG